MNIRISTVKRLEITDLERLDPVRVYLEDYEPGRGRITISCYDMAWVGYWGAMSGRTISEFFVDCDYDYLAGNLICGSGLSKSASNRAYLGRVIRAVQDALREVGVKPEAA